MNKEIRFPALQYKTLRSFSLVLHTKVSKILFFHVTHTQLSTPFEEVRASLSVRRSTYGSVTSELNKQCCYIRDVCITRRRDKDTDASLRESILTPPHHTSRQVISASRDPVVAGNLSPVTSDFRLAKKDSVGLFVSPRGTCGDHRVHETRPRLFLSWSSTWSVLLCVRCITKRSAQVVKRR